MNTTKQGKYDTVREDEGYDASLDSGGAWRRGASMNVLGMRQVRSARAEYARINERTSATDNEAQPLKKKVVYVAEIINQGKNRSNPGDASLSSLQDDVTDESDAACLPPPPPPPPRQLWPSNSDSLPLGAGFSFCCTPSQMCASLGPTERGEAGPGPHIQ